MLPLLVVATIVTATITIIACALGGGRWWGYYPEILWARLWCWLAFVKVKVVGRENLDSKQSYVFVANHQGAYDIFTIYGYLGHNFRWMMKESLRKIPFVGYACAISKQVFVGRGSSAAVAKTIKNAEERLKGGMSIVVFPEGSRTYTGEMGPFKRGAYLLATEFNLPVVPLTIDGAFHVMPRTAKLPRYGHIKLTIHKPIMPPSGGYDLQKLIDDSRETIEKTLRRD